jgi:hypothetical protein
MKNGTAKSMRNITKVMASTPCRYASLTMMALPLNAIEPAAANNKPDENLEAWV